MSRRAASDYVTAAKKTKDAARKNRASSSLGCALGRLGGAGGGRARGGSRRRQPRRPRRPPAHGAKGAGAGAEPQRQPRSRRRRRAHSGRSNIINYQRWQVISTFIYLYPVL